MVGRVWLVESQTEVQCSKKLIRTPLSDGIMVVIYGERRKGELAWLTLANSCKCLAKGCLLYLAYVLEAKLENRKLDDVRVVSEPPDIFPEGLSGLTPDRLVEFRIDIVPL